MSKKQQVLRDYTATKLMEKTGEAGGSFKLKKFIESKAHDQLLKRFPSLASYIDKINIEDFPDNEMKT